MIITWCSFLYSFIFVYIKYWNWVYFICILSFLDYFIFLTLEPDHYVYMFLYRYIGALKILLTVIDTIRCSGANNNC